VVDTRVKVGIRLGRDPDPIGEWLADAAAFDAGGADALWIDCVPDWDALALAAALSVVTFRSRLVVELPEPAPAGLETVRRLSRGRCVLVAECAAERWVSGQVPQGREAWRTACAEAAEQGASGLLVPAHPRLLDILRNPDDPGERHDLQLAQG
jgi:hypothetical protein